MMKILILGNDPHLTQLLKLEVARMGFSDNKTDHGTSTPAMVLIDADSYRGTALPRAVPVMVFSRKPSSELPSALAKRAVAVFSVPFDLLEFRRRLVREMIHHTPPAQQKKQASRGARLRLTMDDEHMTVSVGGGEPIGLSPTEYKLLRLLNDNRGRPVSAADASEILAAEGSNKLNVYICFLRRKLETGRIRIIRTVRGEGYCIDP